MKSFFLFSLVILFLEFLFPAKGNEFISSKDFVSRASILDSSFVITPEKLGLINAGWTVREDVWFGKEHRSDVGYMGARGFEFRYPFRLDPLAEIHTTIEIYSGSAPIPSIGNRELIDVISLPCGISGILNYRSGDPENTIRIDFSAGSYSVNVKTKFIEQDRAVPILNRSARLILREICLSYPDGSK